MLQPEAAAYLVISLSQRQRWRGGGGDFTPRYTPVVEPSTPPPTYERARAAAWDCHERDEEEGEVVQGTYEQSE
jgi:hypothetical protein